MKDIVKGYDQIAQKGGFIEIKPKTGKEIKKIAEYRRKLLE